MEFEGKCKVDGKKQGTLIVLISKPELTKLKNKDLKYRLQVEEVTETDKKAKFHDVKFLGFVGGKSIFEVTSCDSDEKYLVDISTGCGCEHGGKTGVATGKICSHILAVLKKMVR